MTQGYIQLPSEGSGKKVNARHRTVDANDVYEQYVIALPNDRIRVTKLSFPSAALVIQASADGAGVGRHVVANNTGSAALIAVTRVAFQSQLGSALVAITSPRFSLIRFSYTGTPSGSTVAGCPLDSTDAAKSSAWNAYQATTGMTVTDVATLHSFLPIASATAVGYSPPQKDEWRSETSAPLILRAGEGLLVRQVDAATASDTRRYVVTFDVEEYTAA